MAAPLIVAALVSGIDAVALIDAVGEARNPQPTKQASIALACLAANEALSVRDRRTGSFTVTTAFRFPSAGTTTGATTFAATAASASASDS